MRLKRIEAVRFGALEDFTLDGLSDTLTVVHGPNEAGKSTLIALVRSVVYGYRTPSHRDAYIPASGSRLARLIFEDDTGRWAVERRDGTKGGTAVVSALEGPDRPDLLAEISRGVNEEAYRVVFGFGLDEMAKIEEARRDQDSIAGALYSASAGLRVNPDAVRKVLAERRDKLFLSTGDREISKLIKALKETRGRIQEARALGERYEHDRARLGQLENEYAQLDGEVKEAHDAVVRLSSDHQQAVSALERAQQLAKDAENASQERSKLVAEAASIEVDQGVLGAADVIETLLHQRPQAAQAAADAERHRERARAARADFEQSCSSLGLSQDVVRSVAVDGPLAAAVDGALEDIARLESGLEALRREQARAEAEVERADAEHRRALEPLGLGESVTHHDLDRELAEMDAGEQTAAPAGSRDRLLAIAVAVLGAFVFFAGGLWLQETVSLIAGPVLVVLGLLAFAKDLRAGRGAGSGPEAARRRRLLLDARDKLQRYEVARAEAERAKAYVASAETTLVTRREILANALENGGLPRDLDARAASRLLDAIRVAQAHDAEARKAQDEADRVAAVAQAFVEEVRAAAKTAGFESPIDSFQDAASALAVLEKRLHDARERMERVHAIEARIKELDARLDEMRRLREEAEAEARAVFERYERAYASADGLRSLLEEAQRAERALVARREEVAAERSRLEERLRSIASDEQAAEAHFEEAGLAEQIEGSVEQYAVAALGVKLLEMARERYERERQPDVIKAAERIFRDVTGDQYQRVVAPLDAGRIEVLDERAASKDTAKLSKGTAEALYLALRLGLVSRLDGVGPGLPMLIDDVLANFDAERLEGAVKAIAELATKRQVVYFTCHDAIAGMLTEAGPEGTVRVDLPGRI
ncbi:MAG: AAA family ATPase [Anaerosomatales bacterium]|nr:AAA family ATPase [Anaerosomatales bacterium]